MRNRNTSSPSSLATLSPRGGQHFFPAEFQLAGLVGAAEADDHGLSAGVDETLKPTDGLLDVAGENALGVGHGLKGHVVVALDELPHLSVGLGLVVVDVQGGV